MAWKKTPASRKADDDYYQHPEYKKNRALAWQRDSGRCVICGSAEGAQVDHRIPRAQGGTHALANLRVLCGGHHKVKTAAEGHSAQGNGQKAGRKPTDPAPTSKIIFE